MRKSILRTVVVLVGGHLALGLALLLIEAIHGINDQNASFAVALLFHYLNLPTIRALNAMGNSPGIGTVVVVGTIQWTIIALVISVVFAAAKGKFAAASDSVAKTAESETAGDV